MLEPLVVQRFQWRLLSLAGAASGGEAVNRSLENEVVAELFQGLVHKVWSIGEVEGAS